MLHYASEIEKTDVYEQKRTKTEGDVAKLSLPEYRPGGCSGGYEQFAKDMSRSGMDHNGSVHCEFLNAVA